MCSGTTGLARWTCEHAPKTVVVVDDDERMRRLLKLTLEDHERLRVIGEAADASSAVALCAESPPAAVVLGLRLPDETGRDLLGALRTTAPAARVVIHTGAPQPGDALSAERGVFGVVEKAQGLGQLVRTLEAAADAPLTVEWALCDRLTAPATARRIVRRTLRAWRCEALLDDAELVISELVTNAITHAAAPCVVTLRLDERVLRLEVTDSSDELPEARASDAIDVRGRGLSIVAALSASRGVDVLETGKRVWAELHVPSRPTR